MGFKLAAPPVAAAAADELALDAALATELLAERAAEAAEEVPDAAALLPLLERDEATWLAEEAREDNDWLAEESELDAALPVAVATAAALVPEDETDPVAQEAAVGRFVTPTGAQICWA